MHNIKGTDLWIFDAKCRQAEKIQGAQQKFTKEMVPWKIGLTVNCVNSLGVFSDGTEVEQTYQGFPWLDKVVGLEETHFKFQADNALPVCLKEPALGEVFYEGIRNSYLTTSEFSPKYVWIKKGITLPFCDRTSFSHACVNIDFFVRNIKFVKSASTSFNDYEVTAEFEDGIDEDEWIECAGYLPQGSGMKLPVISGGEGAIFHTKNLEDIQGVVDTRITAIRATKERKLILRNEFVFIDVTKAEKFFPQASLFRNGDRLAPTYKRDKTKRDVGIAKSQLFFIGVADFEKALKNRLTDKKRCYDVVFDESGKIESVGLSFEDLSLLEENTEVNHMGERYFYALDFKQFIPVAKLRKYDVPEHSKFRLILEGGNLAKGFFVLQAEVPSFQEKVDRKNYVWAKKEHKALDEKERFEYDNYLKECERDGFIKEASLGVTWRVIVDNYFKESHIKISPGAIYDKRYKKPSYDELKQKQEALALYIEITLANKTDYAMEILSDPNTSLLMAKKALLA